LWFDKEAVQAADFYTSVFENSKIISRSVLPDTPSGDTEVVAFQLAGYEFMAISAGPLFKFNPSVSFLVAGKSVHEVDALWEQLFQGGAALMELGKYPFSERYGWLQDRYGLSWQITLDDGHYVYRHKITPTVMFVGDVCGKAEEAMGFYGSIFPEGKVGEIARYPAGMEPDKEGSVMHGSVTLDGQEFFAMDSARQHNFAFNEAISFIVYCETQQEIDTFWGKLLAVPEAEQCGWLKDRYGLSWQVTPRALHRMMGEGSKEQIARVTQTFLPMKKLEIAPLERAYRGE